jgi:hypothetical protein
LAGGEDISVRVASRSLTELSFYLVLICPSVCYIVAMYFLMPETKGRTLEEIGTLFGDEHVASHWYGISDAEKEEIARNALKLTKSGRLPEEPEVLPPWNDMESKHSGEKVEDTSAAA